MAGLTNPIYRDEPNQTEEQLQQKCFFWFHNEFSHLRGTLFHVPNGGNRSGREGKRFKQVGVVPGVADLLWLFNGKAYAIELKDERGRQSKAQQAWAETVKAQGIEYYVIRSLEGFKALIKATISETVGTYGRYIVGAEEKDQE